MKTCEICFMADINGGTCCIRREPDDAFMETCFVPLQTCHICGHFKNGQCTMKNAEVSYFKEACADFIPKTEEKPAQTPPCGDPCYPANDEGEWE